MVVLCTWWERQFQACGTAEDVAENRRCLGCREWWKRRIKGSWHSLMKEQLPFRWEKVMGRDLRTEERENTHTHKGKDAFVLSRKIILHDCNDSAIPCLLCGHSHRTGSAVRCSL